MQSIDHPVLSPATAFGRAPEVNDTAGTPGSNASGGANITANDFLELLVAEMKNQDPTANTDPNAYIDQLVQVNSLQQLIQINQDLGGTGSASNPSSGSSKDASLNAAPRAISAASRLATSLVDRHANANLAAGDSTTESQASRFLKTAVHQS
ncbi:MAG TPA: flagellar hook capping FlgD N-terminal domain-containing protein [Alloacidobacterium sp.]|jgi:flagellar basal-body rod modification protein FlgD|nr:flagellar hook capping FlgD N-terminal domain-containing protein [Alloacidobacterium sp.]